MHSIYWIVTNATYEKLKFYYKKKFKLGKLTFSPTIDHEQPITTTATQKNNIAINIPMLFACPYNPSTGA